MKGNPVYSISKKIVDKYNLVSVRKAYGWEQKCLRAMKVYWAMIPERSKLKQLKNLHADQKRCFIIGNGPSILQQDLTKLKNEITFVTNWFVLHDQFEELNSNYYCVSDPLMWNKEKALPEMFYERLNKNKEIVKFFEHTAKPICKRGNLFRGHKIYFIWLNGSKKVKDGFISLDISKYVCHGHTVIIDFCLPIAYYMGFKEVYLLGCDCDYKIDSSNHDIPHFYDRKRVLTKMARGTEEPLYTELVMSSYRIVKRVFEAEGRKIYNAGAGGKLEVFERVNYEKLF